MFYKNFYGFKLNVPEGLYCPSDDSILLADQLPEKPGICLDVGAGTGFQALNLARKGASRVLAIDINPKAIPTIQENAQWNKCEKIIEAKQSNLFQNVKEKFDLIVFNPPYVESEDVKWLEVDGGEKGREIIDHFLLEAEDHLNEKGKVIFLQTDLNGIKETEAILKKQKMEFKILAQKDLFFESLIVIEAWKKQEKIKNG